MTSAYKNAAQYLTHTPPVLQRPSAVKDAATTVLGTEEWLDWEPTTVVEELYYHLQTPIEDATADMFSAILTVWQTERPKYEPLAFAAVAWGFSGLGIPDLLDELTLPPYYTFPSLFTELSRIDPETEKNKYWEPIGHEIPDLLYDYLTSPPEEQYKFSPVLTLHPSMYWLKPYYTKYLDQGTLYAANVAIERITQALSALGVKAVVGDGVKKFFHGLPPVITQQGAQYFAMLHFMFMRQHPMDDLQAPLSFTPQKENPRA